MPSSLSNNDNNYKNNENNHLLKKLGNKGYGVVGAQKNHKNHDNDDDDDDDDDDAPKNQGKNRFLKAAKNFLKVDITSIAKAAKAEKNRKAAISLAAIHIADARVGRPFRDEVVYNMKALRIRNSRNFMAIRNWLVTALLLLTYFEIPSWCAKNLIDCENPDFPNFYRYSISRKQGLILEFLVLLFICVDLILQILSTGFSTRKYVFAKPLTFKVGVLHSILVCITLTDYFIYLFDIIPNYPRFTGFLRVGLTFIYKRQVRMEAKLIFKVMPQFSRIYFLLFILIAFYGMLGIVIFSGTDTGDIYFTDCPTAFWNLFVLLTTGNYPAIMVEAYRDNVFNIFYFYSFIALGIIFMMNLLLGIVVNDYVESTAAIREELIENRTENLKKAFEYLDHEKNNYLDIEIFRSLIYELSFFGLIPYIDKEYVGLLMATLDSSGDNKVQRSEFLSVIDILFLEFEKADELPFLMYYFPSLIDNGFFLKLKKNVESKQFSLFTDCIVVINAILFAFEIHSQGVDKVDVNQIQFWNFLEILWCSIYTIEMVLKISVMGFKKYFRYTTHRFDCLFTCLGLLSMILIYYPNNFTDHRMIQYFLLFRLTRIFRLIVRIPDFRIILHTMQKIMPPAVSLLMMMSLIFTIFAEIGVLFFGGKIQVNDSRIAETSYAEDGWYQFNFNDMISGLITLIQCMLSSSFDEYVEPFEIIGNIFWTRVYFAIFYIITVTICLNVSVAFILEAFLGEWSKNSNKSASETLDFFDEDYFEINAEDLLGDENTNIKGKYSVKKKSDTRFSLDKSSARIHFDNKLKGIDEKKKKSQRIRKQMRRSVLATMFINRHSSSINETENNDNYDQNEIGMNNDNDNDNDNDKDKDKDKDNDKGSSSDINLKPMSIVDEKSSSSFHT